MVGTAVVVRPVENGDADAVARFLHEELNPRVSANAWVRLLRPSWAFSGPNHGFQLLAADGQLVGVYAAVYSERVIHGEVVRVCNLAAFCVLEPYRVHSLRLIRPLLSQPGYVFTDFSPSGNVVAMNERLGFRSFDTSTRLVLNLPAFVPHGTRITANRGAIEATLTGWDSIVYRDHRDAPAAEHVLVVRGHRYAYLVYRRERRKRLPLFASALYAGGDRALLESTWPGIRAHLLKRGFLLTLAERRILGFARGLGAELGRPRPKMYRGNGVASDSLDYLYSELALVSW